MSGRDEFPDDVPTMTPTARQAIEAMRGARTEVAFKRAVAVYFREAILGAEGRWLAERALALGDASAWSDE